MIVPLNSDKYAGLFERANIFLDLKGTNEIQNLNQYYAHMKDFYDAQSDKKYQFILMPLNNVGEEDFEIDLNTRAIKVPAAFQKIGAVESDQMAEMFVFKCDRFFDQMDLTSTNIYVQWELPSKEKKATKINMIDLESEPGKIRFAWPIHKEITAKPGVVKFSVRFFSLDDKQENLVYALNTLDSQFTVKSVLVKDVFEEGVVVDITSDFQAAVKNSANAASGIPIASQPSFGTPGLNISKNAFIIDGSYLGTEKDDQSAITVHIAKLVNNTLEVRAQAYIQDGGEITYQWYKDGELISGNSENYSIEDEFIQVDKDSQAFSFNEIYYTDKALDKKYTGTSYPGLGELYERFSKLTIKDGEATVTGVYQVKAINTITTNVEGEESITTSNSIKSAQFRLPEPKKIKFSDPLYEYDINGKLIVNFESGNNVDSTITWKYTNKKYEENENGKINTEGWEDVSSFSSVGYYLPIVSETLNRTTVENIPGEPFKKYASGEQLKLTAAITVLNYDGEDLENDLKDGYILMSDNISLKVNVTVEDPNPQKNNTAEELYKDISYQWYYTKANSNKIETLKETSNELSNKIILEKGIGKYSCVVINDPEKTGTTNEYNKIEVGISIGSTNLNDFN